MDSAARPSATAETLGTDPCFGSGRSLAPQSIPAASERQGRAEARKNRMEHIGLLGQLYQTPGFGQAVGQRFLAEDVDAFLKCDPGYIIMQGRRNRDIHEVKGTSSSSWR